MNKKYQNRYLVLPDVGGNRADTKEAVRLTDDEVQEYTAQGYYLLDRDDFNKLLGNGGKTYLIDKATGKLYEKPAVEPDLDELKAAKRQEIDTWTANKITSGFTSECTGQPVKYDSDRDTQLTMQGIALNVDTERFTAKYPMGCPVRGYAAGAADKTIQYLTSAQVLQWCADLSVHIGDCKQAGWTKQAEVNAATSKADLDKITW